MKLNLQIIVNISIFPLILGFTPGLVSAQIRPDNSLGNENSLVIPNIRIRGINSDQIKGGAIRGGNLFHSFNEFNITPGRGAYFSNPNGINNIFTRVTGNKISNINGTLGVLGDANLFFMNPNGIIFGNGAKLDLNGSFFATTGNVLNFGNDFNFSARDPQNVPIVVHNFEPGLGFGNKVQVNLNETSGDIVIRGKGHNLNSSSFVANQNSIVGLQLDFKKSNSNLSKNTVGLFASNIFMDGGILKAEAGQIELGAIKKGVIDLNINKNLEWNIDYKKVLNQGNINLTNQSLLDASSPETPIDSVSAGSIKLKGFNITLRDNSLILLANRNYAQPGDIILNASNQLKIEKSTLTDDIAGGIISDSLENGAGGKIIISAPLFFLDNSTVLSRASGTGKGGNIEISTQNLQILNESNIDTAAIRSTEKGGGDIIVKASNAIKVSGISSTIRSYTLGFSNGGNIRINANKVTIENGARIGSNVFATAEARFINSNAIFDGRGGNVEIKANNLEIIGSTSRILRSAIGNSGIISDPSTVDSNTFGNTKAGDLNIIVNKLTIKNGAEIRGATFSSGDAANIKIQASDVLIQNGKISVSSQPADARRRAILRLPEIPAGRTGTLSFQVGRLNLDEATITATSASGFGGTIDISGLQPNSPASIISLNNNSAIETNNNTTTDPTRASIDIFTHDLTLNNGSRI
ncbi:MAG: filamentous hemagglutinin N-terminal domain-containing protein, partial [Prochloraceae cyanobacterium]